MKRLMFLCLLLVILAVPVSGQALDVSAEQTTGEESAAEATPTGPSEEERLANGRLLIEKVLEAHGGKSFAEQASQIARGQGRLRPLGQAVTTELETLAVFKDFPNRDRIEMQMPQGAVIQVFDGIEGWIVNGGQFSDQTERLQNRRYYGYDVLRRFDDTYFAKQLDDESVFEVDYTVVRIRDAEGHATKIFIDTKTHRVFQVVYTLDDLEITERYADYAEVSGVQVPMKIELFQGTAKVLSFEVDEVAVNVDLDEALFAKPSNA